MSTTDDHIDRLLKMAQFTRNLIALTRQYNGQQEHWESERLAEAEAMEAGAQALLATQTPETS